MIFHNTLFVSESKFVDFQRFETKRLDLLEKDFKAQPSGLTLRASLNSQLVGQQSRVLAFFRFVILIVEDQESRYSLGHHISRLNFLDHLFN